MSDPIEQGAPCDAADPPERVEVPLPVVGDDADAQARRPRPSRMSRRRAAVLILVHVLIIAHVVHWRLAGRTLSPVEPSESMYTLRDGAINAGFVFFCVALLSTLVLGRFVCGWGCHMIAMQDLCAWLLRRVGIRPRPFRSRLLVWVPLAAALYMFVWPSVYRLLRPAAAEFPGFSNHFLTEDFWKTFPGWVVAVPFVFVCGYAIVYFLGSKGLCTYGCPYGGFFALADRIAPGSIRVTDACRQCGHCTATCTSNVRVHAEVRDFGMVVDPGCMKCLDCVSVCPNGALYFGFGRPSAAARRRSPPRSKRYDLTWPEELLAAASFVTSLAAYRGLFVSSTEAIPFLMALGMAGIFTASVLKGVHLFRRPTVRLQNLRLKVVGRIRPAGWLFGVCTVLAMLATARSAVTRYHRYQGDRLYAQTAFDEEAVLGGADVFGQLSDAQREAVRRGAVHLEQYRRWSWVEAGNTAPRLAWLALIRQQPDRAVEELERAAERTPASGRTQYYLASALSLAGRYAEAAPRYRHALDSPVDADDARMAVFARFRLGNALAETGEIDEAVREWKELVADHPGFAPAHHNLAGAARQRGRLGDAALHYAKALDLQPDDAETNFRLGETLTRMGRPDLAAEFLARAVELDPSYNKLVAEPE